MCLFAIFSRSRTMGGMGRCAAIAMRVEFVQSNVKLLNDRVLQSTSNRLQYKAGNFTLLVRVHANIYLPLY